MRSTNCRPRSRLTSCTKADDPRCLNEHIAWPNHSPKLLWPVSKHDAMTSPVVHRLLMMFSATTPFRVFDLCTLTPFTLIPGVSQGAKDRRELSFVPPRGIRVL